MSNKNKPLKITINKTYIFRYIKTIFNNTVIIIFAFICIPVNSSQIYRKKHNKISKRISRYI